MKYVGKASGRTLNDTRPAIADGLYEKGYKLLHFLVLGSHKMIEVLDKLVRPVGVR